MTLPPAQNFCGLSLAAPGDRSSYLACVFLQHVGRDVRAVNLSSLGLTKTLSTLNGPGLLFFQGADGPAVPPVPIFMWVGFGHGAPSYFLLIFIWPALVTPCQVICSLCFESDWIFPCQPTAPQFRAYLRLCFFLGTVAASIKSIAHFTFVPQCPEAQNVELPLSVSPAHGLAVPSN